MSQRSVFRMSSGWITWSQQLSVTQWLFIIYPKTLENEGNFKSRNGNIFKIKWSSWKVVQNSQPKYPYANAQLSWNYDQAELVLVSFSKLLCFVFFEGMLNAPIRTKLTIRQFLLPFVQLLSVRFLRVNDKHPLSLHVSIGNMYMNCVLGQLLETMAW